MNCHYVSEFYLRRFVDSAPIAAGRLWEADLAEAGNGRRVKERVPPRKAASEEDYYSAPNERAFQDIETKAAPVFRLIDQGHRVLAPAQRLALARLIVSLLPRVPVHRTRSEEELRRRVKTHLEVDANGIAHMIDPDGIPNFFLDLAMSDLEPLIGILLDMSWVYMHAGADGEFLTSDTPVYCSAGTPSIEHGADAHPMEGPGAHITFPFSPKLCLVASWDHPGEVGEATAHELARLELNWTRIKGASYAYCASKRMAEWAIKRRAATFWGEARYAPPPAIRWLTPGAAMGENK